MADVLTGAQRSWCMSRVRDKNTGPEIRVRQLLHRAGYRYRLHVRDLPGRPDLVFPWRRAVIFIHGCFWHQHGCRNCRPATRADYWSAKLSRNVARDADNAEALRRLGWSVLTIWECQTRDHERLLQDVHKFFARRAPLTARMTATSPSRTR